MNKVVASIILGVSITGAGLAQANSDQSQQLAECKAQLASMYGDDTRVRLRGKAAGSESTLTFSVYPNGERHLRVACTRADTGGLNVTDRHGMALALPEQNADKLSAL